MRGRIPDAKVAPAQLSAIFSSVVLKELARARPGESASRVVQAAALVADRPGATVADAFDEALGALLRDYRGEYVFKNTLVSKLVFGYHNPNTASALLELPMGNSCADVMIVNGTSTIYEVKTDLDQFNRLRTQLSDYRTRAEFVNVVVSEGRASAAELHIPDGVGLIALTRRGSLRTLRSPTSNLTAVNPRHLFDLLRRQERLNILERTLGYAPDAPPVELWQRTRDLFAQLPIARAHMETVTELRSRGRGAAELALTDGFPRSLRALAYTNEWSVAGRNRLTERLSRPAALLLEA